MIRLFIAIPLPERTREGLARLCTGVPGARWIPPENLLLTLRFIGEVEETTFADIADALSMVDGAPFEVTIAGVGHFGDRRRARVLWAGVAPNELLLGLQVRIENVLQRAGLEPERRKFAPHITLARLKRTPSNRVQSFLATHAGFAVLPVTADRFTLYSSHLGRAGAIHTAEAVYPLSASAAFK